MRSRWTTLAALGLVLSAGPLAACSGDDPVVTSEAPTSQTLTTAPVTPSETPTPSDTVTSEAPETPSSTVTETATETATATATATATTQPTATSTAWPKALGEPKQGDPVWAVYLAVDHATDSKKLDKAVGKAATVGYTAVVGDLACDQDATKALGLDEFDYWAAAALYFRSSADARTFTTRYTAEVAKPVGSAKVNVGCLD